MSAPNANAPKNNNNNNKTATSVRPMRMMAPPLVPSNNAWGGLQLPRQQQQQFPRPFSGVLSYGAGIGGGGGSAPPSSGRVPPMQNAYAAMRRAQKTAANAASTYDETLTKLWASLKAAREKNRMPALGSTDEKKPKKVWTMVDSNADDDADGQPREGGVMWFDENTIKDTLKGRWDAQGEKDHRLSFTVRDMEISEDKGFENLTIRKIEAVLAPPPEPSSSSNDAAAKSSSSMHGTTLKGFVLMRGKTDVLAGILVNCCPALTAGHGSNDMVCKVWTYPAMPSIDGEKADVISVNPQDAANMRFGVQEHTSADLPPIRHMRAFHELIDGEQERRLAEWHLIHHVPVAKAVVYTVASPKQQDPKDGGHFSLVIVRSPVRKPERQQQQHEHGHDHEEYVQEQPQTMPSILAPVPKRTVPLTVQRRLATGSSGGGDEAAEMMMPSSSYNGKGANAQRPFLSTPASSSSSASRYSSSSSFSTMAGSGGTMRRMHPWFAGGGVMQSD